MSQPKEARVKLTSPSSLQKIGALSRETWAAKVSRALELNIADLIIIYLAQRREGLCLMAGASRREGIGSPEPHMKKLHHFLTGGACKGREGGLRGMRALMGQSGERPCGSGILKR